LGPERIGSHDDESGMSGRDLAAELLESQPAESAASPHRRIAGASAPGWPRIGSRGGRCTSFPRTGLRRVASRKGSEAYRHVGIQDLTIATPQGNRVRLAAGAPDRTAVEPAIRDLVRLAGLRSFMPTMSAVTLPRGLGRPRGGAASAHSHPRSRAVAAASVRLRAPILAIADDR
jgi:hypothetical protein